MVYNIFLTTIVLSRFERIINSINAFNYLLKKYLVYLCRRSKLSVLGWLNQVVQFTHKIAHPNQQFINQDLNGHINGLHCERVDSTLIGLRITIQHSKIHPSSILTQLDWFRLCPGLPWPPPEVLPGHCHLAVTC